MSNGYTWRAIMRSRLKDIRDKFQEAAYEYDRLKSDPAYHIDKWSDLCIEMERRGLCDNGIVPSEIRELL